MNRYIFTITKISETLVQVAVEAETPAEALRRANAALAERHFVLVGTLKFGDRLPPAAYVIRLDGGLDETTPVSEDAPPLADDLWRAYRFLIGAGYTYARAKEGDTQEVLARDEEPLFTKSVRTANGAAVDARLQVRAHYEDDVVGYGFRIEAILNSTAGDLKPGAVSFRARFEDNEEFIGDGELPSAIEAYEAKFLELITLI